MTFAILLVLVLIGAVGWILFLPRGDGTALEFILANGHPSDQTLLIVIGVVTVLLILAITGMTEVPKEKTKIVAPEELAARNCELEVRIRNAQSLADTTDLPNDEDDAAAVALDRLKQLEAILSDSTDDTEV